MDKAYLWEVDFWEDVGGNCPSADFMRELKNGNPNLHEFICKKIRRHQGKNIDDLFHCKDIKKIRNGLMEFSIKAKGNEIRMLGVIEYPSNSIPIFKCFSALQKKTNKLLSKDVEITLARYKKYKGQK